MDYQDAFNLSSGNPDLKPQQIATLEGGYFYNQGATSFLANFYFVKVRDSLVPVSRPISPTVLLTTQENIGRGDVAGVEFAGNGRFSKTLSYNISRKVFRMSMDGTPFGSADASLVSYSLKGGLDYQATPTDLLQVNLNFVGERLLPQGRRLPASLTNIGYRHKFNDRVAGVITITDLFRAQRDRTRIETADFSNFSERYPLGCTILAGLTWQFGGSKPAKDNQFEYGAQLPSN